VKEIKFEDIKKYSDLTERILNASDNDIKYKTKKEIIREFDIEKWSQILEDISNDKSIGLKEIDEKMESFSTISPFFYKDSFYLASGKEVFKKHLEVFRETISPYIQNASAIVELGAGYGSKILNLSKFPEYREMPLIAAEYTENGCESIIKLSQRINKKIDVGFCDLKQQEIEGVDIPENSIIFTSYALHYVQKLPLSFINFMLNLNPKIIINFEPCYELHSKNTHGLICKRYIELNDYNIDMISTLKQSEKDGHIALEIEKNIIGGNPMLPISIIKWASNRTSS
jgi:hypothetical protein